MFLLKYVKMILLVNSLYRLTMTEEIGDKIYEYSKGKPSVTLKNCLSLAQKVYAEVECKAKAVICLVKQGRVKQAVDYAQKLKLNQRDYREVIKACPLPELIHDLYHTHVRGRRLVPLGAVLSSLLETDFFAIGMSLLVEASSKKQGKIILHKKTAQNFNLK